MTLSNLTHTPDYVYDSDICMMYNGKDIVWSARVSDYLCSPQHLRGDVAFSDVYELKEEVGQTATSVCRRCLHRVTAVEYSVKVVDTYT